MRTSAPPPLFEMVSNGVLRRRKPSRQARAARSADLVAAVEEERRTVPGDPLVVQLEVLIVQHREVGLEIADARRTRRRARLQEANDADANRVAVRRAPEPRFVL